MMKSIQYRKRHDISTRVGGLYSPCLRDPLFDALMRTLGIEMGDPLGENRAKVSLPEDDDVIEALAPHATQKPFDHRIHSGRARRSQHDLDLCTLGNAVEQSAILRVPIPNENLRSFPERRGLTQLLRRPLLRRRARHTDVHNVLRVHVDDEGGGGSPQRALHLTGRRLR